MTCKCFLNSNPSLPHNQSAISGPVQGNCLFDDHSGESCNCGQQGKGYGLGRQLLMREGMRFVEFLASVGLDVGEKMQDKGRGTFRPNSGKHWHFLWLHHKARLNF